MVKKIKTNLYCQLLLHCDKNTLGKISSDKNNSRVKAKSLSKVHVVSKASPRYVFENIFNIFII